MATEAETIKEDQAPAQEPAVNEPDGFLNLLKEKVKAKTDRDKEQIEHAVQTLAEQVLKDANLISEDAVSTINGIKAEIDRRLSLQINQILHNKEVRKVESAWRGLHHLVNNTETDEMLKIRVMHISKKELGKVLKTYKGARWDTSPIFKKFHGEEYDRMGGEPFGCIVGDYHFNHSPVDVEILGEMAKIAAACHSPFIAGADPSVMKMDSWDELMDPADVSKRFGDADYAPWRALRDSEDSRYIGLTLPRFLARLPYGPDTEPVEEFNFEENVDVIVDKEGNKKENYTWANSAYAMAVNINKAFKLYGWCTMIRGPQHGGKVEGLPVYTFPTDDGGVDMKCPTEIGIGYRREGELGKLGFIPLIHSKNSESAVFLGAQSLQKPVEYDDPDATANAKLSARLPYLFACCRFAHYLNKIVYEEIGSFKERKDMERWLQKWIMRYVEGDPSNAGPKRLAQRPLAAAEISVKEVEGNPGFYDAKFSLRPHYQLEGLTVQMSLVSKLPSGKK